MYIPPRFAQTDLNRLHDFIESNSFATLVSNNPAGPVASHLPLLLDRQSQPRGRLIGHMARANPQWKQIDRQPVLAVFTGPHAYISPAWHEAADVVPTWNYLAVHVTGTARLIDDDNRLLEIIRRTVDVYEAGMLNPWSLDANDPEFTNRLLASIVGFTIDVDHIEGQWKLSQNHTRERRKKVVTALQTSGDPAAKQIAVLMSAAPAD